MNAGVTRSLSPNQSGIRSGSPSPIMATRPIPLGSRLSITGRMGFIARLYRGSGLAGRARCMATKHLFGAGLELGLLHRARQIRISPAISHARVGPEEFSFVPVRCPERDNPRVWSTGKGD